MHLVDALIQKIETNAILSETDRSLLLSLPIYPKTVSAREDIASQGTTPEHSVFILSGVLVRYQEFVEGERQTVSFHLKGEMPDLHSVFLQRMDHTLGALTNSTIGLIRHDDLQAMFAKSFSLAQVMWRQTLIDAAIFRQWISNNGKRGALRGTAHLLCELVVRAKALGLFNPEGTWSMPLTQQHLADAAGLSIVHMNRTLRTLRHSETVIIDQARRLHILDWKRLVKTAGFDPTYLHLTHNDQFKPAALE